MSNPPNNSGRSSRSVNPLPGSGIRRDLKETWGNIKAKTGTALETANNEARIVAMERLKPNPDQPRRTTDMERDEELARDVTERGVLEPLLVRVIEEDEQGPIYQIIAGERRYRAAQAAGLLRVPIIVKDYADKEARLASLVENLQRLDLSPLDEAHYFLLLTQDYNYSYRQIAGMVNRSPAYVSGRMKLLPSWKGESEDLISDSQSPYDSEVFHNNSNSKQKLKNSQPNSNSSLLKPMLRFRDYVEKTRARLVNIEVEDRQALVEQIRELKEQLQLLEDEALDKVPRETNSK